MKYLLFLIILTLGTRISQARLGETMDQCISRYGQPISDIINSDAVDGKILVFSKNGFVISIVFQKNVTQIETLHKEDKSTLSDIEIQTLLEAEANSSSWSKVERSDQKEEWKRADGAIATYDSKSSTIVFCTAEYADFIRSKNAAEDKAKLNGF